MKMSCAENLMHTTVKITLLSEDYQEIGSATGFFFDFCKVTGEDGHSLTIPTIVSNRHVFQGAKCVKLSFTRENAEHLPIYGKMNHYLLDESILKTVVFHPDDAVDLAVLPIAGILLGCTQQGEPVFYRALETSLIPTENEWKELNAIEDIIMVGYPKGLWDEVNNLPLFRRGITATHPAFDFQGKKEFLMDMACFRGSSGSPIVQLHEGAYSDPRRNGLVLGSKIKLLGIQYSSPVFSELGKLFPVPVQSADFEIAPVMQNFINIGYAIKSTELLAFENYFKNL